MQQLLENSEILSTDRKRLEADVETLATAVIHGESVQEVAHDARNMVTALGLYCDLLEEPGVLAVPFRHYGNELRLVAEASRRLVDKLVTLDAGRDTSLARSEPGPRAPVNRALDASLAAGSELIPTNRNVARENKALEQWSRRRETSSRWDLMPAAFIENMAAELLAIHNLLAALAGPKIVVTVDVAGGAKGARLTGEDLTRVMVNLVKNASEAMPGGGRIQIGLRELGADAGTVESLALTIEDDGPGIPEHALESVFTSGYTTRAKGTEAPGSWPVLHCGLGLAISRSIVEKAGGRIRASNRVNEGAHDGARFGARFVFELPVRVTSY